MDTKVEIPGKACEYSATILPSIISLFPKFVYIRMSDMEI